MKTIIPIMPTHTTSPIYPPPPTPPPFHKLMGEGRLLGDFLMKGNPRRGVHKIKTVALSRDVRKRGRAGVGAKLYKQIIPIFALLPILTLTSGSFYQSLSQKLSGRILLQVESHGEAWYVNPADEKKYYLGRPYDAYNLMRDLGTGITNQDLEKIPIKNLGNMPDNDNDSLNNATEIAIGTNPNNPDTDDDGFLDGDEIEKNYNPLGAGKIIINKDFTQKNLGKIFLQVEDKGQAWYVDPINKKRLYLGKPSSAFQIMRQLSTGITNRDLAKIETGELEKKEIKKEEEKIIAKKNSTPAKTPRAPRPIVPKTIDVIYSAASAIRSGDTPRTLSYFTQDLHKAIEYTMDFLGTEGKLTLGNILSGATLESSSENKKTYSTKVYFGLGGYKVPINFYVEKQENGEWLMMNL